MKKRGVALVVAVLLAGGATAAVFLYVQGVRRDATAAPSMVRVIGGSRAVAPSTSARNNPNPRNRRRARRNVAVPA